MVVCNLQQEMSTGIKKAMLKMWMLDSIKFPRTLLKLHKINGVSDQFLQEEEHLMLTEINYLGKVTEYISDNTTIGNFWSILILAILPNKVALFLE